MDSISHIVLGAAIGEAVLGKKIGRKAMLCGAIADTIPDFDVFAESCNTHAQQLMVHRGITHSFLFVVIIAPILGWLLHKGLNKTGVSWKSCTWLFFWGLLSHIVIDAMTCYGTGWFEPFSSYRVSFNTIFVADPFYTIPLLICVLIALIAKNASAKRVKWNIAGLIISSIYLVFTMLNKWHINGKMKESIAKQNIDITEFVTTPTPLNNFLWMSYAKDSCGFWFGYYSVFDEANDIAFFHVDQKKELLSAYQNEASVKLLKQFSKNYYCMNKINNDVYFNDIRFGQIGGWDKPTDAFVFSFKLNKDADNSMALDRSKFKGSYSDAISSLVTRIKGK